MFFASAILEVAFLIKGLGRLRFMLPKNSEIAVKTGMYFFLISFFSQPAFTCSKLTMKTPERCKCRLNYVKE